MKYIAHIRDDGTEQTVMDHLKGTADRAKEYAKPFGGGDLAFQCGLYHDIGKYSDAFQKYIRGEYNGRVDHSTAGTKFMLENRQPILAFCIAGHHAGIPDMGTRMDQPQERTIMGRSKRHIEDYSSYRSELPTFDKKTFSGFSTTGKTPFEIMMFTRMIFSCLVDADFLDTEAFMSGTKRGTFEPISVIARRFMKRLEEKGFMTPQNHINAKRSEILKECIEAGKGEKGLYTLTVPTGGGKTMASSAFAMEHCVASGMRRVIYVIPYTSIIEQTADVLRGFVNDGDDQLLEHHSMAEYDDTDENGCMHKLATENWDAPVIVTTNVQFFESLFSNRTSKCRKLHHIAQSVIIFDEAQMLPTEYIKPFLYAMSCLVREYGCTVLLCSATQPDYHSYFNEYGIAPREIMTGIPATYEFFRRTSFKNDGECTYEDIAAKMSAEKQTLCITVTKSGALSVYDGLDDNDERIYLSTSLYPLHRKKVLQDIRRRLDGRMPCKVAATSVISVGVDIDFPSGYVELTGIDSMIQAGGRVNREGRLPMGIVHIFHTEDGMKRKFMQQERQAAMLVQKTYEDISSLEAIGLYFKILYQAKGSTLDKEDIIGISKEMAFSKTADKVKIINDETLSIFIPADEIAEEIAGKLRAGMRTRELMREAALYTVNVRNGNETSEAARLDGVGAIDLLDDDIAILKNMRWYDEKIGLIIPDGGQDIMW